MKGNWFVAELEDGSRLRGRMDMSEHAKSGMYPYKIDIHWKKSDSKEEDEDMTAKAEEQLTFILEKDRDAFLVLVSEDDKEYVFSWYTRNIEDFGKKLNQTLMFFPPIPIQVFSMDDPEWTAYNQAYKSVNNFS